MTRVDELFDVSYGHSLALNALRQTTAGDGVAFVSRTARNNGVSAWVERQPGLEPLPAGLLTVCLRSRNYALATFVQPREFYSGYHIYVLTPLRPMSLQEKLWWADCLQANRYRYNFGRQANRSLAALELPDAVPTWVHSAALPAFRSINREAVDEVMSTDDWGSFRVGDLFTVHRGRHILKRDMNDGVTPYIGASAENNGVTATVDQSADFQGGLITISSNGSVGETFYQPEPFIASGDVSVLEPSRPLTVGAALFVCMVLRAEKYRWNYGRKWGISKIRDTVVRLPKDPSGSPDWEAMRVATAALPLFSLLQEEQRAGTVVGASESADLLAERA